VASGAILSPKVLIGLSTQPPMASSNEFFQGLSRAQARRVTQKTALSRLLSAPRDNGSFQECPREKATSAEPRAALSAGKATPPDREQFLPAMRASSLNLTTPSAPALKNSSHLRSHRAVEDFTDIFFGDELHGRVRRRAPGTARERKPRAIPISWKRYSGCLGRERWRAQDHHLDFRMARHKILRHSIHFGFVLGIEIVRRAADRESPRSG